MRFYAPPDDHFGMGSLAPQFHVEPVEVEGVPLDTLLSDADLRRVDVLKIDVEGFERHVLEGAERLLRGTDPPLVVFEFTDWGEARVPGGAPGNAQRLLMDWGFSLWRLEDFGSDRPALNRPIERGSEMLVARRAAAK